DTKAAVHAADAKENGLQVGYYHFANMVPDTAESEANNFMNALASLPVNDLPVVIDLEAICTHSPVYFLQWVNDFIANFIATINEPVMIYGTQSYLDSHLPPDHNLGSNPLWLARYNNDYNKAICPKGWDSWHIW